MLFICEQPIKYQGGDNMSAITQAASAAAAALQANEAKEANNTKENQKKTKFYGKTIGEVQLSEKAASYYEKLKKK